MNHYENFTLPFFMQDDYESRLRRSWRSKSQKDFVRGMAQTGGAVIDLGSRGRKLCDQAVAETDPHFADGVASRVQDAWLQSEAVRKLASSRTILAHLKAAYGREAFPFQTLNFLRGSQQHFHSDRIHFASMPEHFMCGVWIALEDVQPGCGELMYKPGSDRDPVLNMKDVGVNHNDPTYDDYVRHYVPRFEAQMEASERPTKKLRIKKGQAFVWASNLAHGGSAIENPALTRRSLVVHYFFKDTAYYTPMLSSLDGERLQLRVPANVKTRGYAWPMKDGKPMDVPEPVVEETKRVLREAKPHVA